MVKLMFDLFLGRFALLFTLENVGAVSSAVLTPSPISLRAPCYIW